MKTVTIREYMKKEFQEIGPMNLVSDVVKKLASSKANNVIVVDKNQPIGVLTSKDISRIRKNSGNIGTLVVKDVMSSRVIALPPSAHVGLASMAMEELGLSVIPIVHKGKMKGVFNMKNLMNIYDRKISLNVVDDIIEINKDLESITRSLYYFTEKLSKKEQLTNNEVCDLLAFQDSLTGYNKFAVPKTEELLGMTYTILATHLALKYGYTKNDIEGLADYLAKNRSVKDLHKYENDYIGYTRIFDKGMGSLTKEDFNVDLQSVLSQ